MAKCPICNADMQRITSNVEIFALDDITVTIQYSNVYTCKFHGTFVQANQHHRVELP